MSFKNVHFVDSLMKVGGTPKRRLSYNNTPTGASSSGIITNVLKENNNNHQSGNTPFIKRKCLAESNNGNANTWRNNSPFYSSHAIIAPSAPEPCGHVGSVSFSPRHLNESFESLQINNNRSVNNENINPEPQLVIKSTTSKRFAFSRFKSAPIDFVKQLDFDKMEQPQMPVPKAIHPLGDISNQMGSSATSCEDELEMLCFGSDSSSVSSEFHDNFHFQTLSTVHETHSCAAMGNGANRVKNKLKSSKSECFIKQSLDIDASCQNLIGDRSRKHVLPFSRSVKHNDLYSITPETLVDLIDGKFESDIEKFIIIDSRYPYEYEGGHIAGAKNIFTKEKLIDDMFKCTSANSSDNVIQCTYKPVAPAKRVVIIFHCEFSSERGPSLLRFLRNQDRALNEHHYPKLFYPELYLLEGGYKLFYEQFTNFCEPQTYKPMLHAEHSLDLKKFRAKAKSWETQKQHLTAASNLKIPSSVLTINHLTKKNSLRARQLNH